MNGANVTSEELVEWIREWMARELELSGDSVDPQRPLVSYGMDSIHSMMLVGDLEEQLGRRLPPTLTWDHPTVDALARHLAPAATPPRGDADGAAPAPIDALPEHVIDDLLGARVPSAPSR